MAILNYIVSFVERWLGSISSIVLTFLGVLSCVVVIGALWDRRVRVMGATIGVLLGFGLAFHRPILQIVGGMHVAERFRALLILVSLVVLVATGQAYWKRAVPTRHALLWLTSFLALLITAISPEVLLPIVNFLGVPYHVLVAGFGIVFLLLMNLSSSLRVSKLQQQVSRLTQRLECLEGGAGQVEMSISTENSSVITRIAGGVRFDSGSVKGKDSIFSSYPVGGSIRGTKIGAPIVIVLAAFAVLSVGMMTPQAMVGDEVTHYYMLVKQSQDLSAPNFYADIPTGTGGIEVRRYPHSFLWHYCGAVLYHFTGGSFAFVQIYQALFLLQLLVVAYLLARSRGGVESRSALVYVLSIASLPLCLIFSVTFYQDVPMTAQVLTAFYLLSRKRWLWASSFMAFAVGVKVTAVLFFPAFFIFLLFFVLKNEVWKRGLVLFLCSSFIVLGSTWTLGKAINIYAESAFYPQEKLELLVSAIKIQLSHWRVTDQGINRAQEQSVVGQTEKQEPVAKSNSAENFAAVKTKETAPGIIANNPGDLRIKENYLIYGGIILWVLLCGGLLLQMPWLRKRLSAQQIDSALWLWLVGGSYLVLTAISTKTAPDARFFLPGIPFILLPLAEKIVRLPKPKLLITILATVSMLQGGYVLAKAYRLRAVTPEIRAAVEYLAENPPVPAKIFMYPEGNYRLFSVQHEWYLGYRLREFWRADNDLRVRMLHDFGIGAIVVKKPLIASIDEEITNLGVYPTPFVFDIENDPRFKKIFENTEVVIYSPPLPH